jgi:hypothetical protein
MKYATPEAFRAAPEQHIAETATLGPAPNLEADCESLL